MTTIDAIHHTGILTRDLDGIAARYTDFGFTLSPRSRHQLSAGPGEPLVESSTANQCALFGGSYIELLGVVSETAPDPWHARAMADQYEGLRILNLETDDADAAQRRLTEAGLPASGVLELERDVDTEEGVRTMRARTVHIDPRTTREALLGVSQHMTREYVHQPRYLTHRNGARGITAVLIVAADDEFDAIVDRYRRIVEVNPERVNPRTVLKLPTAQLEFLRASEVEEFLPGEPAPAPSYLAAMTIAVDDITAARGIVDGAGVETVDTAHGFFVSARDAYGSGLFFVPAAG
ncbi:glyoxalase-like protein [Nocardia tenerifensis]|uniref:Glyoxalase-like protein n=1 Tax=Nocardia tenerifensis TaxID=228006 RepID=A0A318JUK4_9NOCA|nr:VOC family protein [Nocardia tenerifensis]PXX57368.1 glyoxalase-like protein [Nocardia tenerifensis]